MKFMGKKKSKNKGTLIVLFGHRNGPSFRGIHLGGRAHGRRCIEELKDGELSKVAISRCEKAKDQIEDETSFKILPTGSYGKYFNVSDKPHWKHIKDKLSSKEFGIKEKHILHGTESSDTYQDCLCARKVFLDDEFSQVIPSNNSLKD